MTIDGDWLTPKLMGRLFLSKPPLLQWLSAASIQLAGLDLFSVRLPSLLFGAIGVAIVFAWTALGRNWTASLVAALLLVSNPIWFTFSRLCYTDVVASACVLLAMYTLAADPTLSRRQSRIMFGVFAGAGVLAKSVLGLLPFIALVLYCTTQPRSKRPLVSHMLESLVAAIVLAAPWHLYQIAAHPQWFWADFVRHQLLAVGITEPTGVTGYHFLYLRRLLAMDPVLCVFITIAAYGAYRARRRLDPVHLVALCWAVVVIAALAAFRGRSVSYLVLLVPSLCILAGLFFPRVTPRSWSVVSLILIMAFGLKVQAHDQPWSLQYRTSELPSAAAIRSYYAQNRNTELIIAAPDDEFYSMTLPLPRLRYCLLGARKTMEAVAPHYLDLGIAVTAEQFAALPSLAPSFSKRLADWGVHSDKPIATAILLQKPEEISLVARAHRQADFNVPAAWVSLLLKDLSNTHDVQPAGDRAFFLARTISQRHSALQPLPVSW